MIDKLAPKNVHPVERVLRVVLGAAVLALLFVGPKTPWALLGLVLIATGLLGTCPLYTLLRTGTRRPRELPEGRA